MVEIRLTAEERSLVAGFGFSERDFIFKCVEKGLARLRNAKLEGSEKEEKVEVKTESKVAGVTDAK